MDETIEEVGEAPVKRRRPRHRLLAGVAGAALIAGGASGGLLLATASASTATTTATAPAGAGAGLPGPGGPDHAPPAAAGTVASVDASGNSFTVKNHDGTTVTVDVSSSTTYGDPSVTSPSLSNVTVGEHVFVVGTTSSGTVTATKVMIGMPPRGPGGPDHAPPAGSAGWLGDQH